VDEAVVAADPEKAAFQGRFRNREDRVVIFDAGDVLGDRSARGDLFRFVVAGEIAAHRRPAVAIVGGAIEAFHAEIERVGIVRREDEG